MPKAAAQAATPKKRTRTKPAKANKPAKQAAQSEKPKDWPPDLDDDTATKLFDAVEDGQTIKQAAQSLGLKGNTVYQWKLRYERFEQRLTEAEEIGIHMTIDGYRDITATDRDSAAGAQVAITVLDKYLRYKRPDRFHTNPFKPTAPNEGGMLLGVVVVPAKQALLPHDQQVIDAEYSVSVPAKVAT